MVHALNRALLFSIMVYSPVYLVPTVGVHWISWILKSSTRSCRTFRLSRKAWKSVKSKQKWDKINPFVPVDLMVTETNQNQLCSRQSNQKHLVSKPTVIANHCSVHMMAMSSLRSGCLHLGRQVKNSGVTSSVMTSWLWRTSEFWNVMETRAFSDIWSSSLIYVT